MSDSELGTTLTLEPPDIFPLPAPTYYEYGAWGKVKFGWSKPPREKEVKFVVSSYRWTGGEAVLQSWPLSESGWRSAWAYLTAEHPELAKAVAQRNERYAAARGSASQREAYAAELTGEGLLHDLRNCVFLGGYGFEEGLTPGNRVDIYFTERGIWVSKASETRPYLRRSYDSARALEFEGGAVQKGGGFVGGGFGILGAAEGMAIANLLNSLTRKSSIHTTIRFEAEDAEVYFFTGQALPRVFEMRLADVRARIKARRAAAQPSSSQASDLSDRLLRLGDMLDKGQITPEEFAIAKARLFEQNS